MKPLPTLLSSIAVLALSTPFSPLAFAEEVPAVKIDPKPLPQVAGTLTTFAPVVEKVAPNVVTIATSKMVKRGAQAPNQNPMFNDPMFRRFFGIPDAPGGRGEDDAVPNNRRRRQTMGLGSGVIVSPEGHIITNNHVIDGADEILVKVGNERHEYTAKKIGTDPSTDLAILKIEPLKKLQGITFADSDKIRVGDLAIAVGNPFGLTQSVTMGIVSATGRGGMGITDFENFIQTDASINQGNSGGALVDTEGRLIGINTAIFSRSGGNQGIGFAVPANLARTVMEGLIKHGKVSRGFLGIALQPLSDELARMFKIETNAGALVASVSEKSPAEKAGVKDGDIIVEVSGKKVEGPRELQLIVAALTPGTKVDVKLIRDGQEKLVNVELGERPSPNLAATNPQNPADEPDVLDGVTVAEIDAEARQKYGIAESAKGVVITEIDPESPSADAGLRVGDVIHEINREPITSTKQAIELSEKVKKEKKVLLRVSTKGTSRYEVVEHKE